MKKLSFLFAALVAGVSFASFGDTTSVPKPAGLTDLTDDKTSRVTSTTSTSREAWLKGPETAFHNKGSGNKDAAYRVIRRNPNTCNIIYTFDEATAVNAYAFCMFDNGMDTRAPKTWKFYGSNSYDPSTKTEIDGMWTLIDERDDETSWGNSEYRYFQTQNATAYKSYKVDILANNGQEYTQFNFMEFFFDISAVVPAFGECTFVSVQDGEYELSGVISDIAPTALSLVLTPEDGGDAKSIVLDTPEVGVPFERTVSATGDGLSTTVWYSAKLVAENGNGSSEKQLGRCWFGPLPRPVLYAKKIEFAVSDAIATTLGESTMSDFPVLVRLSSAAVANYDSSAFVHEGRDLYFADADGNRLSFELDTFDSAGETLVWVKIPALSATTKFICYYGGPENFLNEPTDVWAKYLGVWHYNTAETTVPNATANANLDATATSAATALSGEATPFGSVAVQGGAAYKVANYEPAYSVGNKFSVSGWFKMPSYEGGSGKYATWVTKKVGLDWNATTGWYLQMNQSKTTCGLVESGSTETKYSSLPDVTQNWIYFHYVNDGGSEKVYFNGSTTPGINRTGGTIKASSTVFQMLAANQQGDEFRLSKSTWSALRTSLEYKSMKNAGFLSNSGSSAMDVTAPVFETPVVRIASDGSATLTFVVTEGEGDVSTLVNGEKTFVGAIGTDIALNEPKEIAVTIDADACVSIGVYGVNAKGTEVTKYADGGAMNAAVEAVVTNDANERGLVPGVFTISRPNGVATDLPIIVNLSWEGGTAVQGKNYAGELPAAVTIPAGAAATTVVVKPMLDAESQNDETVVLTVAAGAYKSGATATMKILNLVTDPNYNTWVAAADGLASDAANWSKGVPQSDHKILFDPQFSTANCTWNGDETASGISSTIASLTIKSGYSGAVTLMTTFPEVSGSSFHVLTVTGDVEMEGGTISHAAHDSTHKCDYYRLRMDVGGDLRIASGASLSAYCKGSFGKRADGGDASYGGSYNGNRAWGSLERPYGVGASSSSGDGKNPVGYPAWAGGAIWVEVAGKTILDGKIAAEGIHVKTQWDGFSGSGGAIYLKTKALEGTGTISGSADAGKASSNDKSGAGGRVAVELTESELTAFPVANITAYSSIASYENLGGAGTVYVRSPEKPNGILYLRDRTNKYGLYNYRPKVSQVTDIPKDQMWKLDGIVFGANSILRVPADATLELVNGLGSITSTTGSSLRDSGLYVDGGSLVLPEGDQTISGTWTFQTHGATIDRNVTVANGGAIGSLGFFVNSMSALQRCDLTVTGDLTVDSGASISASYGGYIAASASMPGGTTISCHGGQNAQSAGNCAYDSFFNPNEAGAYGNDVGRYNVGGGVVKLVVGGTLTLNGVATAKPGCDSSRPGAAGTINITAARLEGAGSINADGNSREYYDSGMAGKYNTYGASGGGRVAVRLTGSGAEFTTEWISKITAKGVASNVGDKQANSSSAGSVYLQSAAQGEKCGTIIIRNDNKTANDAWTALPGKDGVDQPDDFKKASLSLLDCGKVRLYETLQMANLTLVENCKLDLNGNTLTVDTAKLGGAKLKVGTYAAADYPDFLTGEGSLVVKGSGMVLLVR